MNVFEKMTVVKRGNKVNKALAYNRTDSHQPI